MDDAKRTRLLHQRGLKVKEMREILDRAEAANRGLSNDERKTYDQLEREHDRLTTELRNAIDPRGLGSPFEHACTAEPSATLGRNQRMADWVREHRGDQSKFDTGERFSLGRLVAGIVRPQDRDAIGLTELEQRALSESSDAAGGFLTPELLGAEVIDRLRPQSRVFQAGAQVVPMESDQLLLARLTGGVTPAWKLENNPVTEQSMTFDRVTLQAKTLPLIVRLSRELFDDLSPAAATVIEEEMLAALANELDRVVLRGSGTSPEPRGILNQSGVTLQSLGANGGNLTAYTDIGTAVGTIRGSNLEPNAVIAAARTTTKYDTFMDSTGQPLRRPPSCENLEFLTSNIVPTNLTVGSSGAVCSEIYVAQWNQVLVGMRTGIQVAVRPLQERYADNLQVGLLVYLRADVALRHPEAAVVITGIKP